MAPNFVSKNINFSSVFISVAQNYVYVNIYTSIGVVFYGVEYLQMLDKHAVYGDSCAAITNVYHVSTNIFFQSCPDTVSSVLLLQMKVHHLCKHSVDSAPPDTASGELLLFHHFCNVPLVVPISCVPRAGGDVTKLKNPCEKN